MNTDLARHLAEFELGFGRDPHSKSDDAKGIAMMHKFKAVFAIVLMVTAQHALAQTSSDIWGLPDAPENSGTAGETAPDLGFTSVEAAMLLEGRLGAFKDAGYMTPRYPAIEDYDAQTIMDLHDRLEQTPEGGPCEQAVMTSLFLDAHALEASWAEEAGNVDWGNFVFETSLIWMMPDYKPELKTLVKQLPYMDKALNTWDTVKSFQKNYSESIRLKRARWTFEAVETARFENWSADKIEQSRNDLNDEIAQAAEQVLEAKKNLKAALEKIDRDHERTVKAADAKLTSEVAAIAAERYPNQPVLHPLRREAILNAIPSSVRRRDDAVLQAGQKRAEQHALEMQRSHEIITAAQLLFESMVARQSALARYAAPLARGDCERIKRDGPIAKPKVAGAPLDRWIDLPHDRQLKVLKTLGVTPSESFFNCVCRAARYGSLGTRQHYHPGALEPNSSPSCSKAGLPCVVSGYGCGRHPLPSDSKIFKQCAEKTAEENGNLVEAFEKALIERGQPNSAGN